MSENLTSNDNESDEFYLNNEEIEYKNLTDKLKQIKMTIALLEKTIFR